jgi:hypothetical protein
VEPVTKITLNGMPAGTQALPPGAVARARFQLDGDTPVALNLEVNIAGAQPAEGENPSR